MRTESQVQNTIDRIGQLKARRDQLDQRIEDLTTMIKYLGAGTYSGNRFIGVVKSYERSTTAWKELAMSLGATKADIEAVTKKTGVVSYESKPITNA